MNTHLTLSKIFDYFTSEDRKAISNNSTPVNVHTDFLFHLVKERC